MNTQTEDTNIKRGRGRPRKLRPGAETSVAAPVAAPVTDPLATLVTDRRGAAKISGKSVSTIKRLEQSDPDWPRPFAIGAYPAHYLIEDVKQYVLTKARAAARARTVATA